jgi:polyferredoxin
MEALKSARELVRYRRWTVMRKLIFLPIFLLVTGAVLIIPLIYFAPVLATITFLLTSMFGLPIIHGYIYRLYRELL